MRSAVVELHPGDVVADGENVTLARCRRCSVCVVGLWSQGIVVGGFLLAWRVAWRFCYRLVVRVVVCGVWNVRTCGGF